MNREVGTPRRILVVTPQPFFEDRGSPIALRHVIEAMLGHGYAVDVVCFPFGRALDLPGVRYFRSPNPLRFSSVPIGFSLRKLILDLLMVPLVARRLRSERYVCVHVLEEAAFPVALLARLRGVFLVYDMQSSLPEQLAQHAGFRHPYAQRLLRRCERWLLSRVDMVGCSAGLAALVRAARPELPVVEWQFPGEHLAPDAESVARLRAELGLAEDARVVVYTGSFAAYQGLAALLEAIPRVVAAQPRTVFVLVGAASDEELDLARSGLDPAVRGHVRLLRRVPREHIGRFLALADVLVSTRSDSSNVPLKVFDYLSSSRAIVATDDPAHRAVLNDRVAVLAEPTPAGLAEAIRALLEDPERAAKLVEVARAHADAALGRSRFMALVGGILERARATPR
jgi:glycosyltransferase involved in cell wall biosynthesis